jgi:colicin import membrane protein
MQPKKRDESSLLVNLRELRDIEQQRVEDEELERRREAEAEEARQRAAEQGKRDAAAAAARAAEDAERARLQAEDDRRRADQLRLEEAERVARVQAMAALEQKRIEAEIDAAARHGSVEAKKKHTMLIAAAGVLVLAVGGLGFFAYQKIQENDRKAKQAQIAETERREAERLALIAEQDRKRLEGEIDEINRKLDENEKARLKAEEDAKVAKTKEEIAAAEREKQRLKEERDKLRGKLDGLKVKDPPAQTVPKICLCPENKPMCTQAEKICK